MFFKSLINTLSSTYNALNNNGFSKVNPNIIKYFRNEYGSDWEAALDYHLQKKRLKNGKKAA